MKVYLEGNTGFFAERKKIGYSIENTKTKILIMGEVVEFPDKSKPQVSSGGDIAKRFEGPDDIVVQEELLESHGIITKMFPSLFMSPGDVIQFLEKTRGRVEQIEKQVS